MMYRLLVAEWLLGANLHDPTPMFDLDVRS